MLLGSETMLGLPSTTEVERRLPKEAFYRNLALDTKTREEFVRLIEKITVTNSVKPTTTALTDGERVHEIMLLDLELKGDEQPARAIEAIARANSHMLLFHTDPGDMVYVLRSGLHASNTVDSIVLTGQTLDAAWDSICAQVIFGDVDGTDVDGRIERAKQRVNLEAEIEKLDAACRTAKQINRKNELFYQLKEKQRELEALRRAEGEIK